jgi:uncharacterized protein YraI
MADTNVDPPPPLQPGQEQEPAPEHSDWQAILRNRFIIAGLGALVLLLLTAIVLFTLDGDSDSAATARGEPTADGRVTTPIIGPGLSGTLRTTASMRNGPGSGSAIIGTIRRGTAVTVVGRNEDSTWFQIIHPGVPTIRAWVQATLIDIEGDVSSLVIAGPGEGPDVEIPTFAGPIDVPIPTEPGGTEFDETPTPRPTRVLPTSTPFPIPTEAPTFTPRPTAAPGQPGRATPDGTNGQ